MVALLLLSTWLGTRGLTFDAIWYDEWRSLVYIGKATVNDTAQVSGTLGRVVAESDALNPPAYYFLLSIWGGIVGADVPALRYFSVLLGVLAVSMVYRVGTDVASPGAGLAAAAILGTSALFSVFMHEMRTYTLAVLIVATHLWTYWRCNRPNATRWDYIVFTLVMALALHTHYTAVLMLGGTFVYHLVFVRRKWFLLALYIVAVLLLIPWALVVINSIALDSVQDRDSTAMSTVEIVSTLGRVFSNSLTWLPNSLLWVPAVPLLLALGKNRLLWVHGAVGLAAYLLLNLLVPFACCVRYMLVMLPGLALLAGVGLVRLRWLGVLVVVVWAAAGLYTARDLTFAHNVTNTPRWHYPWQELYDRVTPQLQQDDTVLALLPGGINQWTHDGIGAHFFPDADAQVVMTFISVGQAQALADVANKTAGSERVWVASKSSWRPHYHDAILAQLNTQFVLCGTVQDANDLTLKLYAANTASCTAPPGE